LPSHLDRILADDLWVLPKAPAAPSIGADHNRSYLIGWLRDPSNQKATAHMPKLTLTDAEVQALAAYLGSLR